MSRFVVVATIPFVLAAAPIGAQSSFPADSVVREMAQPFLVDFSQFGIVIGLLDADGSRRIISVREGQFDGRTIFEIGSITKVFTGLLLSEMTERGEVRLDEPVSALLPDGVRVPERSGRPITLVHLATHSSGLPREPDNLGAAPLGNPYAAFTTVRLYDFLRRHKLKRDPGAKFDYSNLGMGLLGHALARRGNAPYETLLRTRVLAPLGLGSTAITLDDSLKRRLATGRTLDFAALAGAGALRSSADDLLTFIAANLTPPNTPLGRAIARSHEPHFTIGFRWSAYEGNKQVGLNWEIGRSFGAPFVAHSGQTINYQSFIGFDPDRRIGVVVLTNARVGTRPIGMHLLSPRYPLMSRDQTRAFRVLVLTLAVLLVSATKAAWKRWGAGERRAALVSGLTVPVAFGWIILAEYVASSAFNVPPLEARVRLLIIVVPLALAVLVGLSRFGARLAELPLAILVGFQSFRIVLEVIMHRAYGQSALPLGVFGWNADIVTGILALFIALGLALPAARHLVGTRIVRAWNWLGCTLLLSLLTISWSNVWATQTTLIALPTFIVPIALLGHMAVFRRLHGSRVACAG